MMLILAPPFSFIIGFKQFPKLCLPVLRLFLLRLARLQRHWGARNIANDNGLILNDRGLNGWGARQRFRLQRPGTAQVPFLGLRLGHGCQKSSFCWLTIDWGHKGLGSMGWLLRGHRGLGTIGWWLEGLKGLLNICHTDLKLCLIPNVQGGLKTKT